jgi:hypothetical protein
MRTIIFSLILTFATTSVANAQCYGDAANSFGCGVSQNSEDSLQQFGGNKNQVLPVYDSRGSYHDYAFSDRETRTFYRRAVRGRWPNNMNYSWSQRTYINTMNASGNPVRTFGNLPWARPRF